MNMVDFFSNSFRRVRIFRIFRKRLPGQVLRKNLLGASWVPLGPSWGRLVGDQNGSRSKEKRRSISRAKTVREFKVERVPKGSQNRRKMAPKTSQNSRRFSRAKKLLSKSLLGPSWADLRAFWEPSWGSKNRCGIGRRSVW